MESWSFRVSLGPWHAWGRSWLGSFSPCRPGPASPWTLLRASRRLVPVSCRILGGPMSPTSTSRWGSFHFWRGMRSGNTSESHLCLHLAMIWAWSSPTLWRLVILKTAELFHFLLKPSLRLPCPAEQDVAGRDGYKVGLHSGPDRQWPRV